MKIRSHTGNMVEVRGNMILDVANPNGESRFSKCRVLYADNKHIQVEHESGFSWVSPELCTMIECPFMVGDEIEERDHESGEYFPVGKYQETDAEALKQFPGLYRHSNPDLRAKGEV